MLEILLQIARIGDRESIGTGQFGKVRRGDLKAVVAQAPLLEAKKLKIDFGYWLTAGRIGDEVERLAAKLLLHNRRVGDPEDDLANVAAGHCGGH